MKIRISTLARAVAVAAVSLAAACSDATGGGTTHQPGRYAVLITDETTGQAYAQVFADGTVQGSITVAAGAQRHLVFTLLTDTNDPAPVGFGDEIRINVTNTVVGGFQVGSHNANVVHGTLTGGQQGQTTLRVQYIQAGFTEYTSPAVTINVT
jgi:hypothetical protein